MNTVFELRKILLFILSSNCYTRYNIILAEVFFPTKNRVSDILYMKTLIIHKNIIYITNGHSVEIG